MEKKRTAPLKGPFTAWLLVVLFGLMSILNLQVPAMESHARIIAVGDVHGDFERFTQILQKTGLIDSNHRWTGEDTILIQTGDFLDRGRDVVAIMDLLMSLEREAPKRGGRVEVLLGNHEILNLIGDLRYVNPEVYADFSDRRSEKRRRDAYEEYVKFLKRRARALKDPDPVISDARQEQWMAEFPAGLLEYRAELSTKGKYGRWLQKHAAVLQVGDSIFLHAGLHPSLGGLSLEKINQRIEQELKAFDLFRQYMVQRDLILPYFTLEELVRAAREEVQRHQPPPDDGDQPSAGRPGSLPEHITRLEELLGLTASFLLHPDGPMWYRGFAQWEEAEGQDHLSALLPAYKASRFVAAHTPQPDGIVARFGGKIFLIDTAMSRAYPSGRASALEIHKGRIRAIYPTESRVLFGE